MAKFNELTGEEWVNSHQKRRFDILVASSLLPVAIPLGTLALGLSRLVDGRDAIFSQERIGQGGKPFLLQKIRTMKSIAPGIEPIGLDEEITDFGRILRPTGIDEIPQLVNILEGNMSIVGPRAMPVVSFEEMSSVLDRPLYEEWLDVYLSSRPGGFSSFNVSHRVNRMSDLDWELKAQMEIEDYQNASFQHDMDLIRQAAAMGISKFFNTSQEAREVTTETPAGNT